MRRLKNKSLIEIIFQQQFTTLLYFIFVFIVYVILFYLASLSLLIETLKYLLPAIILGIIIMISNFYRGWRIYRK